MDAAPTLRPRMHSLPVTGPSAAPQCPVWTRATQGLRPSGILGLDWGGGATGPGWRRLISGPERGGWRGVGAFDPSAATRCGALVSSGVPACSEGIVARRRGTQRTLDGGPRGGVPQGLRLCSGVRAPALVPTPQTSERQPCPGSGAVFLSFIHSGHPWGSSSGSSPFTGAPGVKASRDLGTGPRRGPPQLESIVAWHLVGHPGGVG